MFIKIWNKQTDKTIRKICYQWAIAEISTLIFDSSVAILSTNKKMPLRVCIGKPRRNLRDAIMGVSHVYSNPRKQTRWFKFFSIRKTHAINDFYNSLLVVRGVVRKYFTKNSKIQLKLIRDYLQPPCSRNGKRKSKNVSKQIFLLVPSSCACPRMQIGNDLLVMGFTHGTKLTIDSRSKIIKWNSKLNIKLIAFQRKVNKNPPCS